MVKKSLPLLPSSITSIKCLFRLNQTNHWKVTPCLERCSAPSATFCEASLTSSPRYKLFPHVHQHRWLALQRTGSHPSFLLHHELLLQTLGLSGHSRNGQLVILARLLAQSLLQTLRLQSHLLRHLTLQLLNATVGVGDQGVQLVLCQLPGCKPHSNRPNNVDRERPMERDRQRGRRERKRDRKWDKQTLELTLNNTLKLTF